MAGHQEPGPRAYQQWAQEPAGWYFIKHDGVIFQVWGHKDENGRVAWTPTQYGNEKRWREALMRSENGPPETVDKRPKNGVPKTDEKRVISSFRGAF